MKLILTIEEWEVLRRQRGLEHLFLAAGGDETETLRRMAAVLLSRPLDLVPSHLQRAELIIDYGTGYHPPELEPPAVPAVLPSHRLAQEAKERHLARKHAERVAARQVELVAFAWCEEFGDVMVEVGTDDGQSKTSARLAAEILKVDRGDVLASMVHDCARQLLGFLDRRVREQLGYGAHLGR